MKRVIFTVIIFITLIGALVFNISNANKKIEEFFRLHKHVEYIVSSNKNLDIFMLSMVNYRNFDLIQKDIARLNQNLNMVLDNDIFKDIKSRELKKDFLLIQKDNVKKIAYIQRIKSKMAVLNNSHRNLKKLLKKIENKKFIDLYTNIISLDHNPEFEIAQLEKEINKVKTKTKNDELFIVHSNIILRSTSSFYAIKQKSTDLKIAQRLDIFSLKINNYFNTIINEFEFVIWLLATLLFIAIGLFLIYSYKLLRKQIELNRFRRAVESSDNIIVITDLNKKIKYVNQSFLDSTGYTHEEIIGQSPSMLRSGFITKEYYKAMNEKIYSGEKWTGEFINKGKNGEVRFEKASITPILDEKGNIIEFLGIKLDITKERETEATLKEKEHLLAQQSKMLAMSEMLESIAHQWRQPLSTISTAASGLKLNKEFDTLTDETFEKLSTVIIDSTIYLSETIDNFKSFFRSSNDKTVFNVKETFTKVFDLVGYKLHNSKIEYKVSGTDTILEGLENDLIQSFINVINNSQDALEERVKDERFIFVNISTNQEEVVIKIRDNGLGIDEEIIKHVFEPYFTTKHKSQGTGIGLYMTYEIISKQFYGEVEAKNTIFTYHNKKYKGAEVIITMPIHQKNIHDNIPKI